MTKIFLSCIGKYLRNSDAESIWTENYVFEPNVVLSVPGGTHNVRTFKCMILLCEAMDRSQWCDFFKMKGVETEKEELMTLNQLQSSIAGKQFDNSSELISGRFQEQIL